MTASSNINTTQVKFQENSSFSADGHQAILTKATNKTKSQRQTEKRTNN